MRGINVTKNVILENNREFLKELEGLRYEEIMDRSEKEHYILTYTQLIELSFGVLDSYEHVRNAFHINGGGDVRLYIDKFSLNLSNYVIEYDENVYEDAESAVGAIHIKWLREELIKIHTLEWTYKKCIDVLQGMVDLGLQITGIRWIDVYNTVAVRLSGKDLEPSSELYFDWPQGSVEYLKEKFGAK